VNPERWQEIPEWGGIYSASDAGNVRINIRRHNIRAGKLLKMFRDADGYLTVQLTCEWRENETGFKRAGFKANSRVALLVLAAFRGPRPSPQHQSNHKNGQRDDNRLENLEYATPAENTHHAMRELGRDYRGARNPAAMMTEAEVIELRELAAKERPSPCWDARTESPLPQHGTSLSATPGPRSVARAWRRLERAGGRLLSAMVVYFRDPLSAAASASRVSQSFSMNHCMSPKSSSWTSE
jgi:hypothetical protein